MNAPVKDRAGLGGAPKILSAYYDLSVAPLSFDFSGFAVEAERIRRKLKLDGVRFFIVPARSGAGSNGAKRLDRGSGSWLLHQVLLPIASFLPSNQGAVVCASRAEAERALAADVEKGNAVFPGAYGVGRPTDRHHTGWSVMAAAGGDDVQFLRAGKQARTYARQWLEHHGRGRACVTLTLRETDNIDRKNSDLAVWSDFARRLDAAGYCPVVIRDTAKALDGPPEGFDGIACFSEAAFNLDLRFALYEEAHIAAFVANGPAGLCFYNANVNYIYMPTGAWLDGALPDRVGFERGKAPAFAGEFQRWLWREQDADALFQATMELDAKLKSKDPCAAPARPAAPAPTGRAAQLAIFERIYGWSRDRRFDTPDDAELLEYYFDLFAPEHQNDQRFWLRYASLHFHTGRIEAAMDMFERKIFTGGRLELNLSENDPETYYPVGYAAEQREQFGTAVQLYEASVNAGVHDPGILFRLAGLYQQAERFEDAASCYQLLFDLGVTDMRLFTEMGALYEQMQRTEAALGAYQRAEQAGVLDQALIRRRTALQLAG